MPCELFYFLPSYNQIVAFPSRRLSIHHVAAIQKASRFFLVNRVVHRGLPKRSKWPQDLTTTQVFPKLASGEKSPLAQDTPFIPQGACSSINISILLWDSARYSPSH